MKSDESKRRRGESLHLAWGITAVSALMLVLVFVLQMRPSPKPEPPQVLRTLIAPPDPVGFGRDNVLSESHVSVSPNGRIVAFVAGDRLWLRPLDRTTPTVIPGTEGAEYPFWSPDSRALGFFADGRLNRVAVTGGPVTTICEAPDGRGGAWNADGTILFAPDVRTAIHRVVETGGDSQAVTSVDSARHSTHRWPLILPDGERFLFLAASHTQPRGEDTGIYVADIAGDGVARMLVAAESKPVLSAGRLLYLREGNLFALTVDSVARELRDEPFRVAEGVRYRGSEWAGMFSASDRDVLAFENGSQQLGEQLTWIDRLGNDHGTLGDRGLHWAVRLSPEGDQLAVAVGSPEPEIWIYDLDSGRGERLSVRRPFNRAPVWSPSGDRLALAALNEQGRLGILVTSLSGNGNAEWLQTSDLDQVPTSWSSDGRWLAFDQGTPGATEIWIASLDEDVKPSPFVQNSSWASDAQFSPDGKWLLYTSQESGIDRVYVSSFPGGEDRWQVSAAGWSSHGRWSPTGDKVYFATGRSILMEVGLRARKGGGLDVGMPRMLFSYRAEDSLFRGRYGFYDVTGTQDRFLVAQSPVRQNGGSSIILVTPWSAELPREPAAHRLD